MVKNDDISIYSTILTQPFPPSQEDWCKTIVVDSWKGKVEGWNDFCLIDSFDNWEPYLPNLVNLVGFGNGSGSEGGGEGRGDFNTAQDENSFLALAKGRKMSIWTRKQSRLCIVHHMNIDKNPNPKTTLFSVLTHSSCILRISSSSNPKLLIKLR
jgi:hypothetical protein